MTDTPNARLARVLRLLADVAERGPLGDKANVALYFLATFNEVGYIANAELYATEAARLAGVPVDGWYTSEPPKDTRVLVQTQRRDMQGASMHVAEMVTGGMWHTGFGIFHGRNILAWRPLPEPYRPEEEVPHA